MRTVLILPFLAACAQGAPAGTDGDDEPTAPDAATAGPDAGELTPPDAADEASPDATPPAPSSAAPLLLTEISLAPTGGELIEIANPTDAPVSLADYYVADTAEYFRLPAGVTVGASDFIARFPAGATLAPGEVAVIALDTAAAFTAATGAAPDWSIADGTMTLVAGSAATLTNTGEPVALFHWNGARDTVTDVDLMIAGAPSAANSLLSKGAIAIDGPDADATPTAYQADANTIPAQTAAPGTALSTKRVLLPAGHQATGGNGVAGDETSEDTAATWDTTFTAPTPGATTLAL